MQRWKIYGLLLYSVSALSLHADLLGTASSFAVLGVANSGDTVISENLGVSPGSSITDFLPGVVINGTVCAADPGGVAAQAQTDAPAAYVSLRGFAFTSDLTSQNLGGLTLTPGIYKFDSSAQSTGQLTLDAQNNPSAIPQVGNALTTASNSSIVMTNGSGCCNVYWQVGSSATLGTGTDFQGNLRARAKITMMNNGTSISRWQGLSYERRSVNASDVQVPEPGSLLLLGAGLAGLIFVGRTRRKRAA